MITGQDQIHLWSSCDGCGVAPIQGTRFAVGDSRSLCPQCAREHWAKHGFCAGPLALRPLAGKPRREYADWFQVQPTEPSAHCFSVDGLTSALVRPEFRVSGKSYFGPCAFGAEHSHGRVVLLTALHSLFELMVANDLLEVASRGDYDGTALARCVDGVSLYGLNEKHWFSAARGRAGAMLVLPDTRMGEQEPYSDRDVAAFDWPRPTLVPTLRLAERVPAVGAPVWVPMREEDGTLSIRDAVVVQATERVFIYRYSSPKPLPRNTSGAPIVDQNGHVVAINSGAGVLDGTVFGHGSHVGNVRRHLFRGSISRVSANGDQFEASCR